MMKPGHEVRAHRQYEHWDRQYRCDDQIAAHRASMKIASSLFARFGVFTFEWPRFVPGRLDRTGDVVGTQRRRRETHRRTFGRQVDAGLEHAGQFVQCPFDAR